MDLEAGLVGQIIATTIMTDDSAPKLFPLQKSDDEILRTNQCGHVFHAQCLAAWVLQKKYTCPVCRVVYCKAQEFAVEIQGHGGQAGGVVSIPPVPVW